jgi:hypothetical protein
MHATDVAWNKGRLLGQKPPLKPKEIWSIRIRLQLANRTRDFALFDLALNSKLRGCDLPALRVRGVFCGRAVAARAIVMQRKTQRPVQFEITEPTRDAIAAWVARRHLRPFDYLFPGRKFGAHLSLRQYARIAKGSIASAGLDPARYGTHSLRRTKATLIYKRTKNIRAIQILLGHSKLESTSGTWAARWTTRSRSQRGWKFRLVPAKSRPTRDQGSARNAHRHARVAAHERGLHPLRSPTTSITGKRSRISSQKIFNCISASRLPTHRWIPKPNDRHVFMFVTMLDARRACTIGR